MESTGGGEASDTLLGPEGSGCLQLDLFGPVYGLGPTLPVKPPGTSVLGRCWGWGGAARILRTTQWTRASLWLKFLRAHGGCLGTRNRRRT